MNAQAIGTKGEAEKMLVEAFRMKRKHEENLRKIQSIGGLSGAKDGAVLFGN